METRKFSNSFNYLKTLKNQCTYRIRVELPYFSKMSSVSVHFNLHYEMISETTCLIGVVLLVVMFVLLMVRTRSYRGSSWSQRDGKLCTKPVPEENGEKSCDQVRTVFISYNKH